MTQNADPLRISGHDAVLDPVVHHLDEVPGTVCAAVQITELGSAADLLAPGGARDVSDPGRQRLEDRVETPYGSLWSPDHHAIAPLQAPDAAAGTNIHIVDVFGRELVGAPDVVDVVGVAAVDKDVAALEVRHDVGNRVVHGRGRDHQPDRPRLL